MGRPAGWMQQLIGRETMYLPSGDIGEVGYPELVRTVSDKLPVDPIQRAWHRSVRDGGAHRLATSGALQAQQTHEPLHGTAGHRNGFSIHLLPDFIGAIGLEVIIPDTLNVRN